MMTETTTTKSKRRTLRAGNDAARGMPVKSGAAQGKAEELKTETLKAHEERSDYMVDDHDPLDAAAALAAADAMMAALQVQALPSGMHDNGTRYGPHGLVALEVVGYPVARGPMDVDQWLWDRYMRLTDAAGEAWDAGQRCVSMALEKRAGAVLRWIRDRQRRFLEGYARTGVGPGWTCRSLVVVAGSGIADVGDRGGDRMGRGAAV